jgi:integrase
MGDVHNRGSKDRPMWYCRYIDVDGKRKHRPTHQPTKALAMRFVAEIESRVARGLPGIPDPVAPERQGKALTLLVLARRFLKEANPPTKNPERYRSWLRYTLGKHVLPELGLLPIASLKPAQVEALRDRKLADGYKPATVNSMLKAISVLYLWARKQELHDGVNPTGGLRKTPPTGLMDYLSSDEVTRLLAYTREHAPNIYPMIATAIYTGMRKGELFGLRWIDLLFDRGVIHVAHSYGKEPKSGKWRAVPLHPALAPILRDWQRLSKPGALVFPVTSDPHKKPRMGTPDDMLGLEGLLLAAGCHVPVRPWHAMRHTFASHYVMSGGNLLALQKILGHSKFEMTQIYSHLAPDYMAGEIARLSFGAPPPSPIAKLTPAVLAATKRRPSAA